MLIDIHGHYTTAPEALGDWRKRQAAGLAPKPSELNIGDDECARASKPISCA